MSLSFAHLRKGMAVYCLEPLFIPCSSSPRFSLSSSYLEHFDCFLNGIPFSSPTHLPSILNNAPDCSNAQVRSCCSAAETLPRCPPSTSRKEPRGLYPMASGPGPSLSLTCPSAFSSPTADPAAAHLVQDVQREPPRCDRALEPRRPLGWQHPARPPGEPAVIGLGNQAKETSSQG